MPSSSSVFEILLKIHFLPNHPNTFLGINSGARGISNDYFEYCASGVTNVKKKFFLLYNNADDDEFSRYCYF